MTNKFLKTKAFIPFNKEYKIPGEGAQLLPHSCMAMKSTEKLFVENCRAIYVLTDHVLCSNFFHVSTVLCKSNANEIRRSSFFVLANFRAKVRANYRAMSSEKFRLQTIFSAIFRRNIAQYFERSNEKSLLRKFAEAKIRTATTLYTKPERYLSVAVIQS